MTLSRILPGTRLLCQILIGVIMSSTASKAQQEIVAPLPASINSILIQAGIPPNLPALDPSSIASIDRPESPFQLQPFVFSPHYLYRFLYEYGLQVRPGNPTTTLIDTFAPGIAVEIGSNWTADYTASWDVYSNHEFRDTLGHSVNVMGTSSFENWTMQLTQAYRYSSQPLVETGAQTTEQDYNTALDLSHELGRQFLTETILNQNLRYVVNFPDTYEWSVDEWLHYRVSAQFDAAVGGIAGYVHESRGADSNYTTPDAEVSFQPIDKITIKASGGLEHRVFLDYPRTSMNTPTYDLSVQYAPVETTKLTLDVLRQVTPSYFANESTRNARVDLGLTQRLLGKYFLTAGYGHGDVTYIFQGQTTGLIRDDVGTSYNLRLSTTFFRRGTVSALCYRTKNTSSVGVYGFVTTQFGLEIGYRY
jgi:hypothetical protein